MAENKNVTTENVRLGVAIIGLLIPVFACYYGIKMDVATIQKDVATIQNNVDRVCEKDDTQDISISKLEKSIAILESKIGSK